MFWVILAAILAVLLYFAWAVSRLWHGGKNLVLASISAAENTGRAFEVTPRAPDSPRGLPWEGATRRRAHEDRARVRRERREGRARRLSRARIRWNEPLPLERFDRNAARQAWAMRRAQHVEATK